MQSKNKILNDFEKIFSNASDTAKEIKQEVENLAKFKAESLINKMNVANRDEFDILEKKLELLAKRVSKLEKRNIRKKKR
jgi:BMFP domain-containing protein YqiC|tara:strand:+ start:911 stop:1150 length:240 start_codon:yes stop_codon:yes gene_type:complete